MPPRKPPIRKKIEGAYRHGDLKTAMKRAALRLVQQKGPRGFSINEASRLAGVTVAAPYRHFADKEALLAEIAVDGNNLLLQEVSEAVSRVSGVKEKMMESGMAYLRFALNHSDYFRVMFGSGLDQAKYPEVGRTLRLCFDVLWNLSLLSEETPELAAQRTVSGWALAHGLATLAGDGSLATAMGPLAGLEQFRPLIQQFLNQPFAPMAAEGEAISSGEL